MPKVAAFSRHAENFPTWSIIFIAFMRTKGLWKTLIENRIIITQPANFPENPSNKQRAARDAQQRQHNRS